MYSDSITWSSIQITIFLGPWYFFSVLIHSKELENQSNFIHSFKTKSNSKCSLSSTEHETKLRFGKEALNCISFQVQIKKLDTLFAVHKTNLETFLETQKLTRDIKTFLETIDVIPRLAPNQFSETTLKTERQTCISSYKEKGTRNQGF